MTKYKSFVYCILAAALTFGVLTTPRPVSAGIPVFDGVNIVQSIINVITSITRTLKQVQEYITQIKQYENMLTNSLAPAAYIWDEVTSTINDLTNITNTVDIYKNRLGSLDNYLSKYGDVDYYRNSPCFTLAGCSEAEWDTLEEANTMSSETQKTANDALFKSIDAHQDQIKEDARKIKNLQSQSEGADGHMAALGYANQLASSQANQLIQIRSLLMAQQTATVAKMQDELNKKSMEQAGSELLRNGKAKVSPHKAW